MPDTSSHSVTQRRSALAQVYHPKIFGQTGDTSPALRIAERRNLAITQVDAFDDTCSDVSEIIEQTVNLATPNGPVSSTQNEAVSICWAGPNRWWIITSDENNPYHTLSNTLKDKAAITEQGHGRVVLRVEGDKVRDLLAKGSSIDFHPTQFTKGDCVQTGLLSIPVLIQCLNESASVDIFVARSMAVSFYEWLLDSAGEYGCEVLPAID